MKTVNAPKILAIDTSCDETSVSVVHGLTVLSNVLPSQMEYHKKYGGVVPGLAKFAHQKRIDNVVIESLKRSKLTMKEIDFFAVTIGPGLAIALEVGIKKAIELAQKYKKPLMLINHMEGHLYSGLARNNSKSNINEDKIYNSTLRNIKAKFPSLAFLVSGGHTELVLVRDFCDYKKIGETLDDSAGEAYDKSGRMLGLGYPAGPVISEFAKRHRKDVDIKLNKKSNGLDVVVKNKNSGAKYSLPIALAHSKDYNFSFSGLKTAMKYLITDIAGKEITIEQQLAEEVQSLSKEQVLDLCVLFESATLIQLTRKLEKAIIDLSPGEVFLGGGVVASVRFRRMVRQITNKYDIQVVYPTKKKLTTDNAAMIAIAASVNTYKIGGIEKIEKLNNVYTHNFEVIDRLPGLEI